MSERAAENGYARGATRHQPAYGDGRLAYEEAAKGEEHIDRLPHAMLAVTISASVLAAYLTAAYGVYRALEAV
jgi:multisubunit Na+/H+ antiporter MnhC subunit